MTPNDLIAGGYRMTKVLVHRMVDDLAPAEFGHQPCPGANCAAWVIGHLAHTMRRVADRLGATGLPEIPAELVAKLQTTKKPAENQSGLGDPAELVRLFDTCCDAVMAAVAKVPAEQIAGPSPFPVPIATNLGEGLLFVGCLHVAMHAGQLSTIRRSLGKPPVV
jgi:hypothetical protein